MPGISALAIDLGGSHAACAVVRDGEILASQSIPADGSRALAHLLPRLYDALHALLSSTHMNCPDCAAVVLGFCGIVKAREHRVLAVNGKFHDAPGSTSKVGAQESSACRF